MILSIESLSFLVKTGYPHTTHWLFFPALPLSILAVLFIPYFIPSIVAFARKHHNAVPILLLNIFLGWTLDRLGRSFDLGPDNTPGGQKPDSPGGRNQAPSTAR